MFESWDELKLVAPFGNFLPTCSWPKIGRSHFFIRATSTSLTLSIDTLMEELKRSFAEKSGFYHRHKSITVKIFTIMGLSETRSEKENVSKFKQICAISFSLQFETRMMKHKACSYMKNWVRLTRQIKTGSIFWNFGISRFWCRDKMISSALETSCRNVDFSTETLMEEIKAVDAKKHDLECRNRIDNIRNLRSIRTNKSSMHQKKQEKIKSFYCQISQPRIQTWIEEIEYSFEEKFKIWRSRGFKIESFVVPLPV